MPAPTTIYTLTSAENSLLPTDQEVGFYARHGWYLSRRLFTDQEIDLLQAASERYYDGERDRLLPRHPPNLAHWRPEHGPVQRHNDYVHYESHQIGAILRKPLLGAVAARLAGASEIRVFQSTLIYKPPRHDEPTNVVPWHFDRDYWATSSSERMLTGFIPFHRCDEQIGTITMVDGSHRWTDAVPGSVTARHFADRPRHELEEMLERTAARNRAEVRKVPIVIPKGHVSFHHCRTYHGSGPNRAVLPRRAISLHLQDGENHYRRFLLPDGSVASYNHDLLVRRNADGTPDYTDPDFCPVLWRGAT
ncbi:MAG: phytanoyl-CoA dioxygenase family protein [Natronosporangium sp.]